MRIYISGPITGIPNADEIFGEAERKALKKYPTATVINPARSSADLKREGLVRSWQDWMRYWIRYISEYTPDLAIMLPGWRRSDGAVLERTILGIFGARIIDMDRGQEV